MAYSFGSNAPVMPAGGTDLINIINGISPKPNYTSEIASSGGNRNGLTPGDVNSQFDAGYAKAVGGYDPFPGDKSGINRLKKLYGTVGSAYDVSDTLSALGATRKTNLLAGEGAANTAGARFEESQIPGASNGVGGAMVRAKSLLPFLQQDQNAAGDERKYADSAKQNALSASADIATKLAQLTQNYTDSLAAYNSQKANFGANYAGKRTDLALNASQANINSRIESDRLAEQARQANLQAALQSRGQDLTAADALRQEQIQGSHEYLTNAKGPTGVYQTNNLGQVTSGQGVVNDLLSYKTGRGQALSNLLNIGG